MLPELYKYMFCAHLPLRTKSVWHCNSVHQYVSMSIFPFLQHMCTKCGISSNSRTCPVWLCQICNEQLEVKEKEWWRTDSPTILYHFAISLPLVFCHDNTVTQYCFYDDAVFAEVAALGSPNSLNKCSFLSFIQNKYSVILQIQSGHVYASNKIIQIK